MTMVNSGLKGLKVTQCLHQSWFTFGPPSATLPKIKSADVKCEFLSFNIRISCIVHHNRVWDNTLDYLINRQVILL